MVTEFKEVLLKVEALHDDEQRELASLLQQELAWQASFANSQKELSRLANEALQEHKAGNTQKTDW